MRLSTKPDFQEAAERFANWWRFEPADRALVSLNIAPETSPPAPTAQHATLRDRWLDIGFRVEQALARVESRAWLAETFPMMEPNLGPVLLTALFGGELAFMETTTWAEPLVRRPEDWDSVLARGVNFQAPLWQHMERFTEAMLEQARGRALVAITDLHGSFDTLAGLRDSSDLCIDLVDCPEKIVPMAALAAEAFCEAFSRLYMKLSSAGQGSICWIPAYHPGAAYVPSCDFWCLVSREMAEEYIQPTILREMEPLERSIFHLDGPRALHHLPWLLSLPQLNAIQWVYGAGNGPASSWIHIYRQCLEAGKSVQILADTPNDALEVLQALGPRGVWLKMERPFSCRAEAEDFIREVERFRPAQV